MKDPDHQQILFSHYFQIGKNVIEEFGAFDVSLLSDLPLFIDPFLLFNSENPEYKTLHGNIIRYLSFLRDKSVEKSVTPGLRDAWYKFTEVKQTWLGFTIGGNGGSGLGDKFAVALDANFSRLFSELDVPITKDKHLEKLCLIEGGVGRDNISDLTTNLIKEHLLTYTQEFARKHLKPEQCKTFPVPKTRFNYETESWMTLSFYLPKIHVYFPRPHDDYVLLVPRDLLTRENTWINRLDLEDSFDTLPEAIPDMALRAQINNFLFKALPDDPTKKDRTKALRKTISEFPVLIDYYIRHKEDTGDEAVATSNEKVEDAQALFLNNFTELATLTASKSRFYEFGFLTQEESVERVRNLKDVIEIEGGYRFLYDAKGNPISKEEDLQIAHRFVWFNTPHGTADLVPINPRDASPVSFKLASNSRLSTNLKKRDQQIEDGEVVKEEILVIFHFNDADKDRLEDCLKELKNKPSPLFFINASRTNQESNIVTDQKNSRVFISYSHDKAAWEKLGQDPETHRKRVFELSKRLQSEGVDCVIDRHIVSPPEGWPRWMMNQIEDADFVLVVGTETYDRRFRGREESGKGLGGQWEGAIITQELYESEGKNEKFIPIIFEQSDETHIPLPLRSATYFNVSSKASYDDLYFHLTHQPPYQPTPLGPIRKRSSND